MSDLCVGDIIDYKGSIGVVTVADSPYIGVRWIAPDPHPKLRIEFEHKPFDYDCIFAPDNSSWLARELVKIAHSE